MGKVLRNLILLAVFVGGGLFFYIEHQISSLDKKGINFINNSTNEEDYRLGIQSFNEAIELANYLPNVFYIQKNKSILYRHRGTAYLKLNDQKNALSDFSMAIYMYPDDGVAYFKRGLIYLDEEPEKSITDFKKANSLCIFQKNPDLREKFESKLGQSFKGISNVLGKFDKKFEAFKVLFEENAACNTLPEATEK